MSYQVAPKPQKNHKALWIVLAVIGGVFGLCLIGGAVAIATVDTSDGNDGDSPISNSGNRENPPAEDVTLEKCEIDEFGWTAATLQVTNNTSKASDYAITVEVVDSVTDTRLDELFTFIDALRPGQFSEVKAQGLEEVSGEITCRLLTVERFSAEG